MSHNNAADVKMKKKHKNGPQKASQTAKQYTLHDRSASAASQRMALREGKEGYYPVWFIPQQLTASDCSHHQNTCLNTLSYQQQRLDCSAAVQP